MDLNTLRIAFTLASLLGLAGCVTPAKEREMRTDIFNLQTRILQLETSLDEKTKEVSASGESAKKKIASQTSDLDRLNAELARVRGDIDALKVGVISGQMPGVEPGPDGSIAMQLADVKERLSKVEAAQTEILSAIEKASAGKKGDKADKSAEKNAKDGTFAAVESAFATKKYARVIDIAPAVMKKAKSKEEKGELRFFYAESLFRSGKVSEAAVEFDEYLKGKTSANRLPTTKLRLGDCFKQLGDNATAKIFYEEVVEKYPSSDEAGSAKQKLAELSKGSTTGSSDHKKPQTSRSTRKS